MSIRGIASVGVVLCVAMTAFSIYLGIVEHVYARPHYHFAVVYTAPSVGSMASRHLLCVSNEAGVNTTTTSTAHSSKALPCSSVSARK